MCDADEEEEEVISAAACLKRAKGEAEEACLPPPVPRGASVSAAVDLLREVKGRKETIFFREEGRKKATRRRKMWSWIDSTVRKKKHRGIVRTKLEIPFFQRCSVSTLRTNRSLLVSRARFTLFPRIAAKEPQRKQRESRIEREKKGKEN